jgi:hypothetical protein
MAAYMGTVGEAPPLWAVLVNAGLGFLGLVMRGGGVDIKPPKPPGAVALLAVLGLLAAMALPACPNAYRAGWVSTAALVDAKDATDKGIAKAFNAKIESCKAQHGANQIELQKCVETSKEYEAASKWIQVILPALKTSIRTAKATLEIAEKVQASADSATKKVLSALRDGVCKLLPVLKDWEKNPGFPEELKIALGYLEMIKVVCP